MSASNHSPAGPMPARAPSSQRTPSDTSPSPTPRRLSKDPSRSTSLRKAKTFSELQGSAPVANGKLPKPSRQVSRDAKELRPPTRSATTSFTSASSALDPLSQHILLRTSTADPNKLPRARGSAAPDSPASDGFHRLSTETAPKQASVAEAPPKKGPSLLSRLTMLGAKKKDNAADDDDDDLAGMRTDGTNARVFSSVPSAGGYAYIPHHKEPPRYIKFKRHHKKTCEFNRVFLAQKLAGTRPAEDGDHGDDDGDDINNGASRSRPSTADHHGKGESTGGPVWAMAFSSDGRYLAVAGRDCVVRIFAVISTPEERRAHEEEESRGDDGTGPTERLSAPVFRGRPVREFQGHTGEILDLTWSKNNFLLSTAMDRTVRLWHMSRDECLCAFQHKEPVASVAFHPRDDRFFLAGSVDSTLRLWSIPDKSVAYSAQLPEVVTAVAFSPDGASCMAGTLHGLCLFYATDGLKYQTQVHVRSSRGKNAKGSKITGLHAMSIPSTTRQQQQRPATTSSTASGRGRARSTGSEAEGEDDVKVLVTSTDSRIRIYNLRDKSLVAKFKGHENNITQMRARFGDDGKHIICGSEDKKAYIWPIGGAADADATKDKRPYESFDAHSDMLTAALFAPTATRRLLGQSGDPIYDLCNPPPVTLLSMEEANASQTALSEDHLPNGNVPGHAAPRRPEESPAYISRSAHRNGNIIVTSDRAGVVKVFRQDCAFQKRRNENWETGSTFSRKLTGGRLGRSGSVLTRNSAGSVPASRRASITQPPAAAVQPPTDGEPSDMILSWRRDIESGGSARAAALGGYATRGGERSRSPATSRGTRVGGTMAPINTSLASEVRRHPYSASSSVRTSFPPGSPVSSERMPSRDGGQLPTPSFTFKPIEESGEEKGEASAKSSTTAGGGHSRWNIASRWKGMVRHGSGQVAGGGGGGGGGGTMKATRSLLVPIRSEDSKNSAATTLPERAHLSGGEDEVGRPSGGDGREEEARRPPSASSGSTVYMTDEGDGAVCSGCGGREFRADRVGGRSRFVCAGCGRPV